MPILVRHSCVEEVPLVGRLLEPTELRAELAEATLHKSQHELSEVHGFFDQPVCARALELLYRERIAEGRDIEDRDVERRHAARVGGKLSRAEATADKLRELDPIEHAASDLAPDPART